MPERSVVDKIAELAVRPEQATKAEDEKDFWPKQTAVSLLAPLISLGIGYGIHRLVLGGYLTLTPIVEAAR